MSTDRPPLRAIRALDEVTAGYDALFCDVWGVVHNGEWKSPDAEAALGRAREAGLEIVLLTNSPRSADSVAEQLDRLAFSRNAYDRVVTSGDATRALIRRGPGAVLHVGPARDTELFEGLDVRRVGEDEAEGVVATGLFDDERETPDDYRDLLERLAARGLPMICANPDIVVHRGTRLIFCAGALARDYAGLGGAVALAGKPHRPIYEVAAKSLARVDPRILCIGDGLLTDILGAQNFGADALFVVEGIHGDELGKAREDAVLMTGELSARDLSARFFIPVLR